MRKTRSALFRGRHFQDHVIVLCVRWYFRYCLTLRDLEEMMAERALGVDHSTIGRWMLRSLLRFDDELSQKVDGIEDSEIRTSASKLPRVIISGFHDV